MKKRYLTGSLTVEASLVFPVFFFAVFALCMLFLSLEAKQTLYVGMLDAARDLSCIVTLTDEFDLDILKDSEESGYGETAQQLLDYAAGELTLAAALQSAFEEMGCESGGAGELKFPNGLKAAGFDSAGSDLSGDVMKIRVSCELCIPTVIFGTRYYPVQLELSYRKFSGVGTSCLSEDGEEDGEAGYVYITSNGTVYHTTPSCPALKITIKSVSFDLVGSERGSSGGKYRPCEKCAHGEAPDTVYVTPEGSKYHYRKDCSTLKRDVKKVTVEEAGDREKCKRCGV